MNKTVGERVRAIAAAKGLGDGEELAEKFGVSYETLRKWTTGETAPSRKTQLLVSQVLGVPISEFMHGTTPSTRGEESLTSAEIGISVHSIPDTISWETLVDSSQGLPDEFSAAVPDDALHATSPKGTLFVFRRDAAPSPGKAIIVRDQGGRIHMRRYAQGAGDSWIAQATNDAYVSLDSGRDGLTLVAVATWRSGGDA